MIRPRTVAALMSHGADLCHGGIVIDSTAASFFSLVGMFNFGFLQEKLRAECGLARSGMM